jgi:hypothetical protein
MERPDVAPSSMLSEQIEYREFGRELNDLRSDSAAR